MPFQHQTPRNQYEQAVQQAGYFWVDTVNLRPYLNKDDAAGPPYNRLNPHMHHSVNTHLIVQGKLSIVELKTGCVTSLNAETTNSEEKEALMLPHTAYQGRAGSEGATFVEGHSILSPRTAERLESRGALRWFDDGSGQTREQWFAEERRRGVMARHFLRAINHHGLYQNRTITHLPKWVYPAFLATGVFVLAGVRAIG